MDQISNALRLILLCKFIDFGSNGPKHEHTLTSKMLPIERRFPNIMKFTPYGIRIVAMYLRFIGNKYQIEVINMLYIHEILYLSCYVLG